MHKLWQRIRATSKTFAGGRRRRSFILNVEQLESRRLLSLFGGADVTYHGGPLLQNVQLESVYYGTAWNANSSLQAQLKQTDGFLNYFVTSPYMTVLKQYNVSDGTFVNHDVIAQDATGNSIDDSQIRVVLSSEIAAGSAPKPTANSFYVFFTAPGVTVTAGGQSSASDFAGYHDVFTDSAGDTVYYAVIPYANGMISGERLSAFQQETIVLSHEISEGVTDPDTQTGWFDARLGEIGDIANGTSGILHGYVVQGVWSQADGKVVIPSDTTSTTLHVNGTEVQATAGTSFTSVVATITGADPKATTDSFTASIDWGDGTPTSTGTISVDPKGGFDVGGTHTYAEAGWYPITVTVSDSTGTTVVGTALSKASVAPAPPTVDAEGKQFDATAGVQFSGVVATFTDARSSAAIGDFSATIDWGDGTTSAGSIAVDPKGGFDVSGTHTYATSSQSGIGDEGGDFGIFRPPQGIYGKQFFVVLVTIKDTPANASAEALSLARVAPAPPNITAKGQNIEATSGQPFTGVVATFTDVNTSAAAGEFTATINWGDGTTSAGTITADPKGGFDVSGTHTYTLTNLGDGVWYLPGSGFGFPFQLGDQHFLIHVSITNTKTQDQARAESLATVAPAPPNLSVTGQNIAATVGTQFSGVVATFTDVNPSATAAGFTATIDWGDGTTSNGTISADPKGGFDVSGMHTYAAISNPFPVWDAGSAFVPSGHSFGFVDEGFRLTITVKSNTTTDVGIGHSIADVSPAPPDIQPSGTQIEAVVGTAFTGTVATFTSLDTTATAASFTAAINWGDGTISDGTVVADPKSGYDVTGTHTYTATGDPDVGSDWHTHQFFPTHGHTFGPGGESFVVTVNIKDKTNSSTATAVSLASVTSAPPKITTTSQNLNLSSGTPFTGTVASFTDADGDKTAADFTAVISWGDGHFSDGTITANATGGFDVGGTHTYRDGGTFAILVRIKDKDGDSAVNFSSAVVADNAPPPTLTPVGAAIVQSAEYYSELIVKDYQQYLGRNPASAEVAGWVSGMKQGLTDEQVLAGFAGSPEYYFHSGNNAKAFVDTLYHDLLGRSPDSTGETAWIQALADGAQASDIALGFATSPERESLVVQKDYQQYLCRTAAVPELAGWVNDFKAGLTNEQIIAGFVGSQEYFQKHNANAHDWLFSAYQSVLNRKPDQSGLESWLGVLHGQQV